MPTKFFLDQQLQQDTINLGHLGFSRLLLMNDCNYPWLILVPEIPGITELYQLSASQQRQVITDSCYLSAQMADLFKADKINVAAIGNVVSQLHIHHVVRYQTDKAWPAPVWGAFDKIPYTPDEIPGILTRLQNQLVQCRFNTQDNEP